MVQLGELDAMIAEYRRSDPAPGAGVKPFAVAVPRPDGDGILYFSPIEQCKNSARGVAGAG